MTHYVSLATIERSIFQGGIPARLPAVCGTVIPTSESRLTADCPSCAAWLDADGADDDKTVEEMFGPAPASYPASRPEFDPTLGRPEKRYR